MSEEKHPLTTAPLVYLGSLAAALVVAALWSPLKKPRARDETPRYRVDGTWPKPWVTGELGGTCVHSRDHVFTVNRGLNLVSPETVIAGAPPPVVECAPRVVQRRRGQMRGVVSGGPVHEEHRDGEH